MMTTAQIIESAKVFFRFSAIIGFIAAVTLIINFNHLAFQRFLGSRSRSLWWLFALGSLIPLLLFLYLFTLLFGSLNPTPTEASLLP